MFVMLLKKGSFLRRNFRHDMVLLVEICTKLAIPSRMSRAAQMAPLCRLPLSFHISEQAPQG